MNTRTWCDFFFLNSVFKIKSRLIVIYHFHRQFRFSLLSYNKLILHLKSTEINLAIFSFVQINPAFWFILIKQIEDRIVRGMRHNNQLKSSLFYSFFYSKRVFCCRFLLDFLCYKFYREVVGVGEYIYSHYEARGTKRTHEGYNKRELHTIQRRT